MTEKRQRVVLLGDTLILESVRVSLKNYPGLEILVLDQPLENSLEELYRLHPAVILFDLENVSPDFPLAILKQAGLLLIGINPATDQMLLWSGEQARALSIQDLVQTINAPGRKNQRLAAGFGFSKHLQRFISHWTFPTLGRKQKLGFILVGVAMVVCLGLALSSKVGIENSMLNGAAVGKLPIDLGLAFIAGLLLGGLALALWIRRR